MSLRDRQALFAQMVARLIQKAGEMGYQVTLGDAYRDPRVFGKKGERKGYGNPNSFHKDRLAIDLNLFRNGKYMSQTTDHEPLGKWWESVGGVWGGRFDDGNHYQEGDWTPNDKNGS